MSSRAGISGGFPPCGVSAFRLIDDELGQVKELINEQLAGCSEPVSRLLGTFSSCSGKMLRPGLVLLSYRVMRDGSCVKRNKQYDTRNTHDELIRIAAVIEMIHNAALLHDDVIDEGQKRRGLPTVNSLWGNESAVLLGDFLLSRVFKMCAELKPQFQKVIAATVVRTCEGELSQIIQRRNWQLSESEYIEIITEKSAALFSSCCHLGGLLAGASETQIRSLTCFGLNTGIAFQITDDLVDIIGDESKTGKTLGSDVDKNVGITGSGAGAILGYIVTKNINTIEEWIRIIFGLKLWKSSVYMFSKIPNEIDWSSALIIVLSAVIAAGLGALIPAIIAVRTEPVKILRYE